MCDIRRMPESRFDVVLLDLDGTLTDSAPGIINGLTYSLDAMGIAHPDDATMRTFLGPPLADTYGGYFGMDQGEIDHAIALYREHYHEIGLFENDVSPGIPDLLEALDSAGAVLAVATSKPTYSATRILEHYSLAGHLAFIGGAELDGSRNGKAAVIAHTLEALTATGDYGEGASIIMVGDREHDVRGAATHGIDTIGVLWGYGTSEELLGAGAVALAESPSDLLALLTD
jgi:phosphoglycolate phosphatase